MMFRYKTYKQAIIIAVLVILLCLACLSGATLALFTSNLGDGTIGIVTTAGDVQVDIVDTSAQEASLQGKILEIQTNSQNKTLYFEPGAMFFTQGFKVKNTGNIPINYRMTISEDEDVNRSNFYEVFDVWVTTDLSNLAEMEKLTEFKGRLEFNGDCSDTYYLCIKMKETANNDFQNQIYGVGITVYATQGNVEV